MTHGECSKMPSSMATNVGRSSPFSSARLTRSTVSGTISKRSTSTSPRSVILSDGITESARKLSDMNGETMPTPCSASRRSSVSSRSTTSAAGWSESRPRDGQRQLAAHVAVVVHHDAAADLPEPGDRERHLVVVDADAHDVVGVVGDRRRERAALQAEAAHEPDADAARRVVALDDRDLGDVARGIRGRDAVLDGRQLDARERQQLLGHDLDHAHRPARRRHAQVGQPDRRCVHRLAHPDRHLGARERRDRLAVEDEPAVLVDPARPERDEIVEQHEVGAVARARSRPRRPGRGTARGAARRAAARPRAGCRRRRPRGTSGRCGPRARGSRARGRPCRTRSARARTRARAAGAPSGCARSRPRGSGPRRPCGASRAPPRRSSTRGPSGCPRRGRRRDAFPGRPARDRRRGSRRAA